jgi:hypothetical protein
MAAVEKELAKFEKRERELAATPGPLEGRAERCRLLAKNADEFTQRRLFVLAVHYEKRVKAARPSGATHILNSPPTTKGAPVQV